DVYRTTPEVVNEKFAGMDVLGIDEEGAWNTPYLISRADTTANTMFIGLKNVWRSTNIKTANKDDIIWNRISNNLSSNTTNLAELEQCISNPNILYASKDNRKLFRTNNALADSVVWTNLSLSLPVAQVTVNAIETSPLDSNLVWIGFNKNVYRSSNQGANWTNITLNFPDLVINSIVLDTTHAGLEALYIGTDMGVYYKDTTLTNFIPFHEGFPTNARVTELEIYYGQSISEHRIKASTYGRGLWESDLYSALTQNFPPVAAITLTDGGNETYGSFAVDVIFYKSLNEVEMVGFNSLTEDVVVSNGVVTSITGGPSSYQLNIAPTNYGEVSIHVPHDACFDAFNMGNFASDTLRVFYLEGESAFGRFGPGGIGDVSSLAVWLRGDLGVTQNGSQQVSAWNDQGGSGLQAFQSIGSNRPTWVSQGIAGRPALAFDGVNDMLQIEGMRPGRSMSAFIIVETDTIKFNDHGWFASSRMENGYLMHPWKNDYYYHNEVLDNAGDYSGINSFYIGDASAPHIYGFVYHQDDIHQTMTTHFDEDPYPQPGVDIG
ncbi:MAG: WD40/YVTN/BNR-like repeat-containing protein, partial [Flavobacteriales bacterium]